jgi:hypothetical protein
MKVVAIVYGLVGLRGVFVFIVIFVGGYVCMEAYFVSPVCMPHGSAKLPVAPPEDAAAALPASFSVGGPVVPLTD